MNKNTLPELEINKEGKITNIYGKVEKFKIGKYVTLRQSTYPEKIFVLQEILFESRKKEIRLGYYIIGKKEKMKGKWVWGQFCPFLPMRDFIKLIELAKKERII